MDPDLRCGNKPCGEFFPHRFYEDKRPVEVPYGDIKDIAFTVFGTKKCESPSGECPEFQRMHIDDAGQQWWWKTNEGEIRCSENHNCKEYYSEFKQRLSSLDSWLAENKKI